MVSLSKETLLELEGRVKSIQESSWKRMMLKVITTRKRQIAESHININSDIYTSHIIVSRASTRSKQSLRTRSSNRMWENLGYRSRGVSRVLCSFCLHFPSPTIRKRARRIHKNWKCKCTVRGLRDANYSHLRKISHCWLHNPMPPLLN